MMKHIMPQYNEFHHMFSDFWRRSRPRRLWESSSATPWCLGLWSADIFHDIVVDLPPLAFFPPGIHHPLAKMGGNTVKRHSTQ